METDILLCVECEEDTKPITQNIYEISNGTLCETCYENSYYTCEDCDNVIHSDNANSINGGTMVCESCYDNYFLCSHCDEMINHENSEINTVRHNDYCNDCYNDNFTMCNNCGDAESSDDIRCLNDTSYCEDCWDNDVSYCDDCDEYYDNSNGCDNGSCSLIHSYSYKPEPIFYGKDERKLFFGMELELQPKRDRFESAAFTQEVLGDMVYLKSDGSLCGNGAIDGYEIVTHPISASQFLDIFPVDKLADIATHGAKSWNSDYSCGIHIHMSRVAFTARHMNYFMKLIYNNASELITFSGRDASYAKYEVSKRDYHGVNANHRWYSQGDRYVAVNLQNDATVELRFFRGTLEPQTVKAYVEFVNLAYDYTKNTTYNEYKNGKLEWKNFVAYTESRATEFPNIQAHRRFTQTKGEIN